MDFMNFADHNVSSFLQEFGPKEKNRKKDGIMSLDQFCERLAKMACDAGFKAEIRRNYRRSDGSCTGILIDMGDTEMKPLFAMDDLYEDYMKGAFFEMLACNFIEAVRNVCRGPALNVVPDIFKWDNALQCLSARLIRLDDKEYLKDKVFRRAGNSDLAEVCVLSVTMQGREGVVTVTKALLDIWGIDEDRLFSAAEEKIAPCLTSAQKVLGIPESEGSSMTIVSTGLPGQNLFGAAVILKKETHELLDRQYPEGYYLLPLSIHEWIAVSCSEDSLPIDAFKSMVKDINDCHLTAGDILSDGVYIIRDGLLERI